MQYPLNLSFKIMALSPQIAVTDADGEVVMYVKQKLFKLKEAVTVFADREQTKPLFKINADRVIDFSAQYNFSDITEKALGSVKRRGMKSIWKSHYDIAAIDESGAMTIQEENPWVKVLDSVFTNIPLLGMFAGYVFHPSYAAADASGTPIMRLKKQPAFLEGKFTIDKLADLDADAEVRILLSFLMMLLLERAKG